ncbi:hypothetical protein RJ640_010171 [Escallonia rubra]|uniref:DUF7722 domain-containing protein n=1 Tax=Escallonia rubra TaxID=112253 RepID=A0AA88UBU3_9ASTE|nr:hypothetical protein RJ640_010171 [Escallonia rubra]
MALKWLVYSAHTIVLGHPQKEEPVQGVGKSLKVSKDGSETPAQGPAAGFQVPLHYPRYKKEDYKKMEEWKVDNLLGQYGLSFKGSLDEKRAYAMGTFLWPDQL